MSAPDPKAEAERQAREEYRRTHGDDGYALGSPAYPNATRLCARQCPKCGGHDA